MVIERYRQERERQRREEYKQTPEGIPPTLKEILSNPVYSEMLNVLLEQSRETALREKNNK